MFVVVVKHFEVAHPKLPRVVSVVVEVEGNTIAILVHGVDGVNDKPLSPDNLYVDLFGVELFDLRDLN
jgi:hypothetical protein